MTWSEDLHPRDGDGQFTRSSIGAWANAAADRIGAVHFTASTRQSAMQGEHPAGHAAAKARLQHLWDIPDRKQGIERTDAQQAELNALEHAFDVYRFKLGLKRESSTMHVDANGMKWTEHGEYLGHVTEDPPLALQRGYTRVGDAPGGEGRVGGVDPRYYRPSLHPAAGGVWIDPTSPGTRHAPRYLNDMGHGISEMRPKPSRSELHKDVLRGNRMEGRSGGDVEHETTWRGQGRKMPGRIGYDMPNREGTVSEFLAAMKRKKARAKVEASPKRLERRTPRGTQVESWMGTVSGQAEQRGARRG